MKRLLFILMATSILVGCSKDDGEKNTSTLSVDPTALSFTAVATESHNVAINTNQSSWDAVSNQTWCSISKSENQFTVTASANTASTERKASITVSAGSASNVIIEVTQTGVAPVDSKLKSTGYDLAYTIKIAEQYKKGLKPGYIENEQGKTLVYVNYHSNNTLNYLNIPHTMLNSTVVFNYSIPTLICTEPTIEEARQASVAIQNGEVL